MMTEEQVRSWLRAYAWLDEPQEARDREVECIIAQGSWPYIDALADRYAGAQWEGGEQVDMPGFGTVPEAFAEGVRYALSALYECHTGPHISSCPRAPRARNLPAVEE